MSAEKVESMRVLIGFDALVERFLSNHSSGKLAALAEIPRPRVEELLRGEPVAGPFDVTLLFCLARSMELLMSEGAAAQLADVKSYLAQCLAAVAQMTESDEGVLEEKDIEQLSTLHYFVDQRLTRMIEHLS